jgi:hypothetical protein
MLIPAIKKIIAITKGIIIIIATTPDGFSLSPELFIIKLNKE